MRFDRVGIIASLIVAALSLGLSSCGGSSSTPAATGTASIRFINGSPDAGAFDVLLNGKVIASNVAYGQITAYQTQTTGTSPLPQIAFVKTGTQVNIFPPIAGNLAQTFQLGAAAGTKLTIVVEGRAAFANGPLQLAVGSFVEPTPVTGTGQYSIVFHHASPAANAASPNGISVGQVALGASPVYTIQGQILFSTIGGNPSSLFGLAGQTAIVGPPGVGFFGAQVVVPTATPTPLSSPVTSTPSPMASVYAAIVPGPTSLPTTFPTPPGNPVQVTGVDSANTTQSLPFNNDQVLFVYLIDDSASPTGVQFVGTFTN